MIYLGGGGSAKDEAAVFAAAFTSTTKKISIWPWAQSESSWEGIKNWLGSSLAAIGIRASLDMARPLEYGFDSDIIVIPGGNTFVLLHHLQTHDLVPRLKAYLDSGGGIYGGSAGAVILGLDIEIIDSALGGMDEDLIGLRDRRGLDLLKGWSVFPHYELQWKNHCEKWSFDGDQVLGIPEKGGMKYDPKTGFAINLGPEDIWVFERGKGSTWVAGEQRIL